MTTSVSQSKLHKKIPSTHTFGSRILEYQMVISHLHDGDGEMRRSFKLRYLTDITTALVTPAETPEESRGLETNREDVVFCVVFAALQLLR